MAVHDFGLPMDALSRISFRAFDALCERRVAAEQREDLRFGVLDSLIANQWRDTSKHRAAKPEDFFPSLRERKRASHALDAEGWYDVAKAFVRNFGGDMSQFEKYDQKRAQWRAEREKVN